MRIENWAIVTLIMDPHAAPETQTLSLGGNVFGHPRFKDEEYITTSSIVGKNTANEVLTTSGSSYKLGQVNPNYEEKFPNAKDRLLNSLSCKSSI